MQQDSTLLQIIPVETRYWFVRTETGTLVDTFLENGYISVGWNSITPRDLTRLSESEVKEKIFRTEGIDSTSRSGKMKATDIYRKLMSFAAININDIVVIPSENSELISIGIVTDADVYSDSTDRHQHFKRRNVKWLVESKPVSELDNKFYKFKKYRRFLYDITDWSADLIDSVLYNVYQKGEYSHFVLKVNTDDPINWRSLNTLLTSLHELLNILNDQLHLDEDVNSSTIKINVQSKGRLNLSQKGVALLALAVLLGATGCKDYADALPAPQKEVINSVRTTHAPLLDTVAKVNEELNVYK